MLAARRELEGYSEADARNLRAALQDIFIGWRDAHGTLPPESRRFHQGLLSFRLKDLLPSGRDDGRTLLDWHPYACTPEPVGGYVGLLWMLLRQNYEPLHRLSKLVPWNEVLAVMVLAESFDIQSGDAGMAYELLQSTKEAAIRWESKLHKTRADRLEAIAKRSEPFLSGGRHKKGTSGELKRSLGLICRRLGTYQYSAVLKFLKECGEPESDAEEILQELQQDRDRVTIAGLSVDEATQTFSYTRIDQLQFSENAKTITLRRLAVSVRSGPS